MHASASPRIPDLVFGSASAFVNASGHAAADPRCFAACHALAWLMVEGFLNFVIRLKHVSI